MAERREITEPDSARKRRNWGLAVALLIVAVTVLAVFKHVAMGGLSESRVRSGLQELSRAVEEGDASAYDSAVDDFRDAASLSILDFYPGFLLHASLRMKALHTGEADRREEGDAVLLALLEQDWSEAQRHAEELGAPESKQREYYLRFTRELRQVAETKAS